VSVSVDNLQDEFHKPAHDITTAITLTLLFRIVGALIFGTISDRYGRKWPLVCNLLLMSAFQLGAGFAQTFGQFLVLRSFSGIFIGGIWGVTTSNVLENVPLEARGFISGVLQQGYAAGYIIAAAVNLSIVPQAKGGWRALFWIACGLSFATACFRALLPESEHFLQAEKDDRTRRTTKTERFSKEIKGTLKRDWLLCIYAVLLMGGLTFLSHASQDLYPTFLQTTKGFIPRGIKVSTIFGNLGGTAGSLAAGHLSQRFGRRLAIINMVLMVGAYIPLWVLPNSFFWIANGVFCMQSAVQGAWGVIPIYLAEISPPALRATFPGVAYALGNMISSASVGIERVAEERFKTTIVRDGQSTIVPDYTKIQEIFIGLVALVVVVITLLGPENHGSRFEQHEAALEDAVVIDSLTQRSKNDAGSKSSNVIIELEKEGV
jgi:SHS family lactate transporter-like MFS transporter